MLYIKEVETASDFLSLHNAEDNTKDYLYICKYDETIRLSDKGNIIEFGKLKEYGLGAIKIGTWHDGKPLYRKIYKITTPINQDSKYTIDVSSLGISEVVRFYGYARFTYTDDNNIKHTCCIPITSIVNDTIDIGLAIQQDKTWNTTVNNNTIDYYNPCGVYYDCTTGELIIKSSIDKQLTYTEIVIEYIKGTPPDDEDNNNNIISAGGDSMIDPEEDN